MTCITCGEKVNTRSKEAERQAETLRMMVEGVGTQATSHIKSLEMMAEQEKYRWPTGGFSLSQVKTEDCEVGERCVAPLEVSRGIRDYSCSFAECRHLHFTALDGPQSVREHMKLHHNHHHHRH